MKKENIPEHYAPQAKSLANTITIASKNVWGNDLLYVISEHSDAISRLTGKKTVDANDISALRQLGFEVQQIGINF